MKNVITFLDANNPIGNVHPGGVAVLKGDAPVWRYCNLFHKCIMEGSAVVAIAHGIDTSTNGGDSVIAYSTEEHYQIGKTINCANEEYMKQRLADPNYWSERQAAIDAMQEKINNGL